MWGVAILVIGGILVVVFLLVGCIKSEQSEREFSAIQSLENHIKNLQFRVERLEHYQQQGVKND